MYDLHTLGWSSFQQLCLTITREILGQTVEAFLDSGDGGRDGAFTGTWKPGGQEDLNGAFVIQCKHTTRLRKRDYVKQGLKTSDLTEEFDKATTLLKQGLCDSYVLITNARLTGMRGRRRGPRRAPSTRGWPVTRRSRSSSAILAWNTSPYSAPRGSTNKSARASVCACLYRGSTASGT